MTHRRRAWAVFAVMAAMFCLSQFYRMSVALIAVDLETDLGLDPGRLSLLVGAFFYAFAAVQLPLGTALDRWGAKRVVVAATLTAAAGSLLFGLSPGWTGLLLGRVLMGLGMAPVLMGSFKLIAEWFPATAFGRLSGLILAVGTLGSLLAATPLAWLVGWLGWRGTFVGFGALTLASTAAIHRIVRDRPRGSPARGPGAYGPLQGLGRVLGTRSFWAMVPLCLTGYATLVCIQGLWAGPYFMDALGYSRVEAGNILLGLGLFTAAGSVAAGLFSDRVVRSRKWVIVGGNVLGIAFLLPLAGVARPQGPWGWAFVLSAFGFFSAARSLLYAHVKESVPPELVGTAVTAVNLFVMLGPALFQQAMGLVLTLRPGDYAAAFLVPIAGLAVGIAAYLFTRDTHPTRPQGDALDLVT